MAAAISSRLRVPASRSQATSVGFVGGIFHHRTEVFRHRAKAGLVDLDPRVRDPLLRARRPRRSRARSGRPRNRRTPSPEPCPPPSSEPCPPSSEPCPPPGQGPSLWIMARPPRRTANIDRDDHSRSVRHHHFPRRRAPPGVASAAAFGTGVAGSVVTAAGTAGGAASCLCSAGARLARAQCRSHYHF